MYKMSSSITNRILFSLTLALLEFRSFKIADAKMIPSRPNIREYNVTREKLLNEHLHRGLGFDEVLNDQEEKLNEILMNYKEAELMKGLKNPNDFAPARHVFDVLDEVKNSPLFQLLKKMPKGAVLHAHDTALTSTDYVLSLTYWPNLWQCGDIKSHPQFIFASKKPKSVDGCEWSLVADEREKMGKIEYDKHARKLFTLLVENPVDTYKDINTVWNAFMNIFMSLGPIVTYAPVWKDYYYNALKEFYDDGVQLLEFRGILPELYDLNGKTYGPLEVVGMYYEVLQKFKSDYPKFIDSKLVYAPIRHVNDETFDSYFPILEEISAKYPDFVVGFDLVGQEDLGRPLTDYVERLLAMPNNVSFFFHAGETNWNGLSSDENLIDAILLGTKRIGHGFGIVKYPTLMELIKQRDICIEINPISNQVLKLVDDIRNHPAAVLFSDNYPIVISSDDPSFWEATPLTHDFYFAFLGIASAKQDLRTLKKLILNSIRYSSLTKEEKTVAFNKWKEEWDRFVASSLREHDKQSTTLQLV